MKSNKRGLWLLAAGASAGLLVSVWNYFAVESGIDHSAGALLVIVASLLLLGASVLLAAVPMPHWMTACFLGLLLLGLAGTAMAAYFLESQTLLLAMALGLAGWALDVGAKRR